MRNFHTIQESLMSNADGPQFVRSETYVDPVMPDQPGFVSAAPVVAAPVAQPLQVDRVAMVDQPVVQRVVQQPMVAAAPVGAVRTGYSRRFAPDAVICALVGLFLLMVGLIAAVRGGFDGSMKDPVVEVLGFTHTTTLGLIGAFFGVCLLIAGATSSRSAAIFFGSVLGIAGFVGAVQAESFEESLALESGHAWLLVVLAVAVVLSALLLPRFITRSNRVQAY